MSKIDKTFQAIRLNEWETYLTLIEAVDINSLNEYQQNFLHEAVAYGANRIAEQLIAKGVNLNQQERNGQTPLHYAAQYKNEEVARMILEAGGDCNVRDNFNNNALWTAVFNARGDYQVVRLLISHGADVHTKNNAGRSPIDFANQIKDQTLISLLTTGA